MFSEISTGGADDLSKATEIAHSMVTRFGMTDELGQIAYEAEPSPFLPVPGASPWQTRRYSEESAAKIDHAVRAIVDEAFARAVAILRENRSILETTATQLLAHETLGEADLKAIAKMLKPQRPARVVAAN